MFLLLLSLVALVSAGEEDSQKTGRNLQFYPSLAAPIFRSQDLPYVSLAEPLNFVLLPRSDNPLVSTNKFYSLLVDFGFAKYFNGDNVDPEGYTLFLPTNAALESLPNEYAKLLMSDNALMQTFLKNHIVKGNHLFLDFPVGQKELKSLSDNSLYFQKKSKEGDRSLSVNNADVIMVDSRMNNAVIHTIDTPLRPAVNGTILDILKSCKQFAPFLEGLQAAELTEELGKHSDKGFTLFAPIAKAFKDFNDEDESSERLTEITKGHLIKGVYYTASLEDGLQKNSESDTPLKFNFNFEKFKSVNEARVLKSDVVASNGVIHVIDSVLEPLDLCFL